MFPQPLEHLESQVQSRKGRIDRLEQLHHAQALPVMLKSAVLAHAFR